MILSREFYVYGASLFGQALVDFLVLSGKPPIAIIDAFPKIDSYKSVPIIEFSTGCFDYSKPVFVTILGYPGVEESISERGFDQVYDAYSVFQMFPDALKTLNKCGFLWMKEPVDGQWNDSKVERLCGSLSDQKSIDLLTKIISYRKNPSLSNYPVPETYAMYNPADVPLLYGDKELRILDVGAYDGDTYEMLRSQYGDRIRAYCAIEASPRNVEHLRQKVTKFPLPCCDVTIVHGAVGLPLGKNLLIKENKSASTVEVIDDNEIYSGVMGCMVPNINLNDFSASKYNFIKMDIEGADFSALKQLENYISEARPNLALSVYHSPGDLWEMPIYLDEITGNGYRFYLRQEGHWLFETQLYAVRK